MYKATRKFIAARQPHTKWKLEVKTVRQIGGGQENNCRSNSNAAMISLGSNNVGQITGWIVGPYDPKTNSTEIIQHWWNWNKGDGTHFDTSPLGPNNRFEYIHDIGLLSWIHENDHRITDHVGSSLLLKDDILTAADEGSDGTMVFRAIGSLSCDELWATHLLKP
jgi:hypothetical protein